MSHIVSVFSWLGLVWIVQETMGWIGFDMEYQAHTESGSFSVDS